MEMLGIPSIEALCRSHTGWVEEALARCEQVRESKWTESIAVGSRDFVDVIKRGLRIKAKGRRISGMDDDSELRPQEISSNFDDLEKWGWPSNAVHALALPALDLTKTPVR